MKELSIEEKYKKALERAKEIIECSKSDTKEVRMVLSFFPELKECEDKRMIQYFKDLAPFDKAEELYEKYGFSHKDAIAWFEKQGEQKPVKSLIDYWKEMRLEVWAQASGNRSHNVSTDNTKMFSLNDIDEILEKIGDCQIEHKPEESKPKFKVGDWIINETSNFIYKVLSRGYEGYMVANVNKDKFTISLENEERYHLWTIQDAKDGDMIYVSTEEKGIQAIFYKYEGGIIYFHCNLCGDFIADGYMPIGAIEFMSPLQKVHYQRFFEKMHEAGYEWDAELKQLKKIEQKPATMSLDEAIEHCKEKSCGNSACALEHKQLEKWLIELKEQKPAAWSDEDEKNS